MKYTQVICKYRIRLEALRVQHKVNVLRRLFNKQHLVDAFSRPDYWLLNFQESKMRLEGQCICWERCK